MSKPQVIWVHDENFPKIATGVQEEFSALTQSVNFILLSIAIGGKSMALIYVDLSGHALSSEQTRAISRALRPA